MHVGRKNWDWFRSSKWSQVVAIGVGEVPACLVPLFFTNLDDRRLTPDGIML